MYDATYYLLCCQFYGLPKPQFTFENVRPKLYPVLCWKHHNLLFFFFFFLDICSYTPHHHVCIFPFYTWCLIEVRGWLCFNFWPHCKILFFFQSYCSNGSSRYLTHPRAALYIERQRFRLWMIFSKNLVLPHLIWGIFVLIKYDIQDAITNSDNHLTFQTK